jgi:membrane protease YdiL (CAAX protease family)
VFINAFVCVIGLQPVFQLLGQLIEWIYAQGELVIKFASFDQHNGGLIFVLLNSVVVGPVVEEILFRGVALRALSRYGRNFAIVTGAALFGFYHANFLQFGHSFAVGLILGYVTFRYAIKWAIVLHCLHNLLMTVVAMFEVPWFINYGFFGVFFLWTVVIIIVKSGKLKRFFDKGRSLRDAYKYAFTVPCLLAYIAVTIFLAVAQADVMPADQVAESLSPGIPSI